MDYRINFFDFDNPEQMLSKIVNLQNIVYKDRKKEFKIEQFKFWYLDNPNGKVISFNAFYGEELVAHYACIPIQMKIDNRITNGLLDIATVTHPSHRGKGLFKKLAQTTFNYAKDIGYEFVIGVANANSFPGYMKYFPFEFVSKLDVKWGFGGKIMRIPEKTFAVHWNKDSIKWRSDKSKYFSYENLLYSTYNNIPFVKLLMGIFNNNIQNTVNKSTIKRLLRPINLYIGLGIDLSKNNYFNIPKFVKHSPFNLIFLDLTNGNLPKINKDNIFFQLIDFDVA